MQLYLGYNPLSKLEVVSGLNVFNYASGSFAYNSADRTQKYTPKVYLGTLQSIANWWNHDNQNGTVTDQIYTKNIWPKNYQQDSQKGEANISLQ